MLKISYFLTLLVAVVSCQTKKKQNEKPSMAQKKIQSSEGSHRSNSKFDLAFELYQSSINKYMATESYKNKNDDKVLAELNTSAKYAKKVTKEDIKYLIETKHFSKMEDNIEEEYGEKPNWDYEPRVGFGLAEEESDEEEASEHSKHIKNSAIAAMVLGSVGLLSTTMGGAKVTMMQPNLPTKILSIADKIAIPLIFLAAGAMILQKSDAMSEEDKETFLKGAIIASGSLPIAALATTKFGDSYLKGAKAAGVDLKNGYGKTLKRITKGTVIVNAIAGAAFIAWGASLQLTGDVKKTDQEIFVFEMGKAFKRFLDLETKT